MAKKVFEGERLNYINSTGSTIAAGTAVVVGNIVGIAEVAIPSGTKPGALTVEGVFTFEASSEVTQGALVYLDSNGKVTTTATSNTLLGVAWTAASASGKPVDVRINFGDLDTDTKPSTSV